MIAVISGAGVVLELSAHLIEEVGGEEKHPPRKLEHL